MRPLTDSALTLPPQFHRDGGKSQQEWLDETERLRTIRGNFIADAYDIENKLGRLLKEIFYPSIPWHPSHDSDVYESHYQLREVFAPTFIESSRFNDRIRMLKAALAGIAYLRKSCPPKLIEHLNQVRETRNRFAHDPIKFEYTDPPNPTIKALLVGRNSSVEVTSDYVMEQWTISNECSAELGDLIRTMEDRFRKFQHRRET